MMQLNNNNNNNTNAKLKRRTDNVKDRKTQLEK